MNRPTYPFDVRSRDVWRIALPASVAFITEPLAGLVDITVIGRLGDASLLGGLVIVLAAAFVLQPLWGNTGLWVAIHVFFIARAAVYWWALERKKPGLFAA